jgi:hypothetical protein
LPSWRDAARQNLPACTSVRPTSTGMKSRNATFRCAPVNYRLFLNLLYGNNRRSRMDVYNEKAFTYLLRRSNFSHVSRQARHVWHSRIGHHQLAAAMRWDTPVRRQTALQYWIFSQSRAVRRVKAITSPQILQTLAATGPLFSVLILSFDSGIWHLLLHLAWHNLFDPCPAHLVTGNFPAPKPPPPFPGNSFICKAMPALQIASPASKILEN